MSRYQATTNPTATNDSASGYVVGSVWVNTATSSSYICTDNTASAAVWRPLTGTIMLSWSGLANGDPATGQTINATYAGTRTDGYPIYSAGSVWEVQLTSGTNNQNNSINWNVSNFDFTKDFMFSATLFQNSTADGCSICVGGSSVFTSGSQTVNGGLCFQYNTFSTNNNTQFYINGSAVGSVKNFGNGSGDYKNIWFCVRLIVKRVGSTRTATIIHGSQHIQENAYLVTSWTPGGTYVGVSARTGAANGNHFMNSVQLEYI
jgi:hypothetical protein